MTTHYEHDLELIRRKIYRMADLAMEDVTRAVESLKNGDTGAAEKIIEDDRILDSLEVEIDEDCIRFIVTRQPAAVDLRLVLAMLKITTDLERIGDLSGNIAKETIRQDGAKPFKAFIDIPRMSGIATDMMRDTFAAMSEMDGKKARRVIERDVEIDALNLQVYRELFSYMAEESRLISRALGYIMVAKHLERIGDHIANIAERAVYYIEGVDIRHLPVSV